MRGHIETSEIEKPRTNGARRARWQRKGKARNAKAPPGDRQGLM